MNAASVFCDANVAQESAQGAVGCRDLGAATIMLQVAGFELVDADAPGRLGTNLAAAEVGNF